MWLRARPSLTSVCVLCWCVQVVKEAKNAEKAKMPAFGYPDSPEEAAVR